MRLEKAQRYDLVLYRRGTGLQLYPHCTVILCSKEEVHAVFDLCKQAYFDDYLVYWPHSHDGSRLAMSIWNVGRWMTASRAGAPHSPRLLDHACQADEPNRLNGQENNAGAHTVLTQWLKASPALAGIPIIMMTGDANMAALSRSMEAGAASFVVKPFTRESLTSKLEAALAPSAQFVG